MQAVQRDCHCSVTAPPGDSPPHYQRRLWCATLCPASLRLLSRRARSLSGARSSSIREPPSSPAAPAGCRQCLGFCGAAVGAVGERLEPRPEGEPERAGSAAKRCRARRTSASCTETAPRCRHVRCSAAKSTPMSFRQPCRHGMKQPAN